MYPASIVLPMKSELTTVGFEDLTTPDEVKESIKAQIRSNRKSITYFKDASGRYILSGIQIPGLPSGGSVEISPELQAELSLLLPAVPEMVSPVKVGTLIQFKPVATPSVGGAASFLRSSSPTRMGGGAASSSFGHELR